MELKDTTIIVPIFNRQKYINNVIEYYKGFNLLFVDSSNTPFDYPEEVNFIECSGMLLYEALNKALKQIDTKYVCWNNDDDIATKDFLVKGEEFLLNNPDYSNVLTYSITGEINQPGTYPLKKGRTLRDAIQLAGGLSELGSNKAITIEKEIQFVNDLGEISLKSELVGNVGLDFEIGNKDKINILPITNVINVSGNVYNPGLVALTGSKSLSIQKAIELAGGYKPYSLRNKIYVVRANGEIEKVKLFRVSAKRVFPGDSVFVPLNPNPQDFDISLFVAELSTTLANIFALIILAENNTN